MERTPYLSCPPFLKLLMDDDFNRGIRIPHSFSSELEGRKSPCNYSLITEDKRRSSNHSWRAKVVKKDHHYYMCKKSWPVFVRDYNLKFGDYLLFHLIDKTTFWVTPYGANGSKKMLDEDDSSSADDEDSDTNESESDEDDDVRTSKKCRRNMTKRGGSTPASKKRKSSGDHEDCDTGESDFNEDADDCDYGVIRTSTKHRQVRKSDEPGGASRRKVEFPMSNNPKRSGGQGYKEVDANSRKEIEEMMTSAKEAEKLDNYYDLEAEKPCFIRTIKKHNMLYVVVPRPFAVATNLDKTEEVVLESEDGDYKRLWRAKMIKRHNGRIDIGDGWSNFRKDFNVKVGETCRFTIINRHNLIAISIHIFR